MVTPPAASFRLAEQIGRWGIFADITISVALRTPGSPFIAIGGNCGVEANSWEMASIGFGVSHALQHIPNSDDLGATVLRLHTNPVDTTAMALAFAACHATFKCFEVMPASAPYFDRSSKTFVFPDPVQTG